MHRHAMNAYPKECCGVLVGRVTGDGKEVEAAWRLDNVAADEGRDARRRYLIAPKTYVHLEERADEQGVEIVGVYHSHPDHPANPSDFDREHALPFLSYVIVSVRDGKSEDLGVWLLADDRQSFLKEELVVR